MGRTRLMTILAAVVVATTCNVSAASAQLSIPGVGDVDLGTGGEDQDCLEIGVDLELGDLVGLDPSVCVLDEDGDVIDLEGGVSVGDEDLDVGEATRPVEDAVNEEIPPAARHGGSAPSPATPEPEPETPSSPAPGSDRPSEGNGGSGGDDAGDASGGERADAPDPMIAARERNAAIDRDRYREHQLANLRALRSDLSSGSLRADSGVLGPVAPGIPRDRLAHRPGRRARGRGQPRHAGPRRHRRTPGRDRRGGAGAARQHGALRRHRCAARPPAAGGRPRARLRRRVDGRSPRARRPVQHRLIPTRLPAPGLRYDDDPAAAGSSSYGRAAPQPRASVAT